LGNYDEHKYVIPLHPQSTSSPMTCTVVFNVLYRGNIQETYDMVSDSSRRVGADWVVPTDMDTLRCMYLVLLHRDIELKNHAIKGGEFTVPLEPRKAEAFFLALGPELVEPWLANGTLPKQWLIDRARDLFLIS
jgi:hypothetical protein